MILPLVCATFLLIASALLVAGLARSGRGRALVRTWWRAAVLAAVVLCVLTIVFDNVMIAVGLFAYGWEHMSGLRIGLMPVEDLTYPLAALIGLPGVWLLLEPRREREAALARIRSADSA